MPVLCASGSSSFALPGNMVSEPMFAFLAKWRIFIAFYCMISISSSPSRALPPIWFTDG